MSAKKLSYTDWLYIAGRIDRGYIKGQIRLVRNNKEISGWWFLTDEGIIIKNLN